MKKKLSNNAPKITSKRNSSKKIVKSEELIQNSNLKLEETRKNESEDVLIVNNADFDNAKKTEEIYKLDLTPTPIDEEVKIFENEVNLNNKVKPKNTNKTFLYGSIVAVILALLFIVVNFSSEPKDNNELAKTIIAEVNNVIITPPNEEPAIALVENPLELAKTDKFYEEAQEGDYVIVYSDRAILFDPKSKKLRLAIPLTKETSGLK